MFWPFFSILIVVVSYWKIFSGFFIQDEWLSFAYNFSLSHEKNLLLTIFAPSAGHYQPLNTFLLYELVSVFKVNYLPFALISLFLHLVCVFLVFLLAKIAFKNNVVAFMISTLFGVMATTYQATFWVMADLGTHISTIFALASILMFVFFLKNKKMKFYLSSVFFIVTSLFFKESTIGVLIFLPVLFYFFADKDLRKKIKYPIGFFVIGGFYFLGRVMMIFLPGSSLNGGSVLGSQSKFLILYNILSFPVKSFSQILIPSTYWLSVASNITLQMAERFRLSPGSLQFNAFAEHRVLEVLSLILFVLIICFSFYISRKNRNALEKKIIWVSIIFVILNGFVFGLAPERSGIISDLDSRNLYFVSMGMSFLIILFLKTLFATSRRKVFLAFLVVMLLNIYWLNNRLAVLVSSGGIRKSILSQIKSTYPFLPRRALFYTVSDSSFYGLPVDEKIMPFQSGFGQTLLVTYDDVQNFPVEMLSGRFLWNITEEGYKEVSGTGFGYYRNFTLLKSAIQKYNLPVESVFAFSYDSRNVILTNITEEVRLKLKNETKK